MQEAQTTPKITPEKAVSNTEIARKHAADQLAADIFTFIKAIDDASSTEAEDTADLAEIKRILVTNDLSCNLEHALAMYVGKNHIGSWEQMLAAERLLERILAFTGKPRYIAKPARAEGEAPQYIVYDRAMASCCAGRDGKILRFKAREAAITYAADRTDNNCYVVTRRDDKSLLVHAGPMPMSEATAFAKACGEGFRVICPVQELPGGTMMTAIV